MFGITISDAIAICKGKCNCDSFADEEIKRIVIDSRTAESGDMFVAFKGDQVDGHDYIQSAFDNGATCALAQRHVDITDRPVIYVDDVLTALEDISHVFRMAVDCPVIGVTGSVGKTTTKEMIAAVLSSTADVYKTYKNHNNRIGVPMTLSGINQNHEAAVIEMGISFPGEMNRLAYMVRPQLMVFTSIGHAHLEFLGDLDGVFKEKTSVISSMFETGTVIANGDDEYLKHIDCRQNLYLYGTGSNCTVRAENIKFDENIHPCFDIVYGNRKIPVTLPAFGRHLIYATLAGATVGFVLGLSDSEIKDGISKFEVVGRRGAVYNTGFVTLVDDCYNSNLDSCKMSLKSLIDIPGRHVAILGDFLEQGDKGPDQHREIGRYAKELGVDTIVGVGKMGKYTSGINYATNQELIDNLNTLLKKGDIVLVKASLGVHLDQVSEAIKQI